MTVATRTPEQRAKDAARQRLRRQNESAEEKERRRARARELYRQDHERKKALKLASYHRNRDQQIAYAKRKRQEQPELFREYEARWREKNRDKKTDKEARRRARLRGAPIVEPVSRLAIYERDGGICHICEEAVSEKAFHLDHLIPLAQGGDHAPHNLRVAHPSCNSRMGAGRLPAQLLLVG